MLHLAIVCGCIASHSHFWSVSFIFGISNFVFELVQIHGIHFPFIRLINWNFLPESSWSAKRKISMLHTILPVNMNPIGRTLLKSKQFVTFKTFKSAAPHFLFRFENVLESWIYVGFGYSQIILYFSIWIFRQCSVASWTVFISVFFLFFVALLVSPAYFPISIFVWNLMEIRSYFVPFW